MILTESQLRAFLPALPGPAVWVTALVAACERFAIGTPVRVAAFLAQVAHESSGLTRLVENLKYTAPRLMKVWPTRFPTLASALPYEYQPEKLANHVYANRNGNGDTASGDGWRYRGRGVIQLTGRTAYQLASLTLGLPLEQEPDRVAQREEAALTAAHYWHSRGLNRLADENTEAAFDAISRKINGGSTGLLERRALWARAKAALA